MKKTKMFFIVLALFFVVVENNLEVFWLSDMRRT